MRALRSAQRPLVGTLIPPNNLEAFETALVHFHTSDEDMHVALDQLSFDGVCGNKFFETLATDHTASFVYFNLTLYF